MSTDFVLYAMPASAVPDAKRYAATSMGYGNVGLLGVLNADTEGRLDIFERDDVQRFIVGEHFMHGADERCLAHALVAVIGHDCPAIDPALIAGIGSAVKGSSAMDAASDFDERQLEAWLAGATGKYLWYVFE